MSGVCRFGCHLKELRIHLCQTGTSSKGVRDFIKDHYVSLKTANPNFPILIRECAGIEPRLWARYDMGKENNVSLANLKASDVLNKITSAAAEN